MVLAAEPSSRLRCLMYETRLLPSGLGLAMMHLPLRTFVNTMRCSQLLQSNYIASLVLHFSVQHRLDSTCAMAASPLQALPPEIFESINVLLSLRDLSNVRLVSRSMASKATQDRFASFVRSRSVELTRPTLETMAALTAEGRIGCLIQDLTLAGVVYNTAGLQHQLQVGTKTMLERGCEASGMLDESTERPTETELARATAALNTMQSKQADYDQLHDVGGDVVALLAGIFQNIAANTKRHGLASLSLDVREYRQDAQTPQPASDRLAWRSVWHIAEQTFHTVTRSLGATLLPIQDLNLFCNDFSGRCSLQCNQLSRCDWSANGVVSTLASVESLAISISDRVLDETAHDALATGDPVERVSPITDTGGLLPNVEELEKQANEDQNFDGLVTLLNSCQNLKKLDLRRCHVRRRRFELNDPTGKNFIQRLAEAARLENITNLSLGNFAAREQDLTSLLKRNPVRNLSLIRITLEPGGSWDAIFDHCTSTTANNIHALHLEDLSQDYKRILFGDSLDESIENSLPQGLRKLQNVFVFVRQSDDLEGKPSFAWCIPRFRHLGPDPVLHRRMERLRNMFGPPASHYPGSHH
jgi:hypothetical protein